MSMQKGEIVKWMDRGFGFIQPDGTQGRSDQVFVHKSQANIPPNQLRAGTAVEYEAVRGNKGMEARNVRLVGQSAATPTSGYRFLNPYNFVRPLPPRPTEENAPTAEQLLSRTEPPPHDRWLGLSGKITGHIEVKTPLFVSASEGVTKDEKNGHATYRFFSILDDQGIAQKAIPASTLRGVIRSTYEAATNSCFSQLANTRLSYRLEAKEASKLVPGRVVKTDEGLKVQLLTGTTKLQVNKQLGKDTIQYAAWLHQYWPVEPSNTLEKPLSELPGSQWHKNNIRNFRERTPRDYKVALHDLKHGDGCFAILRQRQHPFPSIRFWDVMGVNKDKKLLDDMVRGKKGFLVKKGWLCLTNQNTERKHSERFFFTNFPPQELDISEHIRNDYKILMTEYYERHRKDVKKWQDKKLDPNLAQPETGSPKTEIAFSRFVVQRESQLEHGTLVYVKLKGTQDNFDIEALLPVTLPRVLYENGVADLIEDPILHHCQTYDELCPACRLFGWVHGNQAEGAYRGRVRFEHALLKEERGTEQPMRLAILSSPNPTTTYFYLADKNGQIRNGHSHFQAGYNNKNNRLRGRKFYRHYVPTRNSMTLTESQQNRDKNWEQNRTIADPVGEGSKFKFDIYFENLAEVELGALLWALSLDGEAYHKLGYGKPLGLGSIEFKIDHAGVILDNMVTRYTQLEPKTDKIFTKTIRDWHSLVTLFKQTMTSLWKRPFSNLLFVRDLMALLGKNGPELPVHYPYSPDRDSKGSFEWFVGNTGHKGPKLALPLATDTEGLPLLNKRGQKRSRP